MSANRAEPLMPYSTMPRAKQYQLAWGLLEGHAAYPAVTAEERSHAKCWLTYRCCDLEISYADYRIKIEPVSVPVVNVRWQTSLEAARIFCHAIHAHGGELWHSLALDFLNQPEAPELSHPPAIQNVLRVGALMAYHNLLGGDTEAAIDLADDMVDRWKLTVGQLDWRDHPYRFAEMHGDLVALEACMSICRRAGAEMERRDCDELTGAQLARQHKEQPWMRALMRLNRTSNQVF